MQTLAMQLPWQLPYMQLSRRLLRKLTVPVVNKLHLCSLANPSPGKSIAMPLFLATPCTGIGDCIGHSMSARGFACGLHPAHPGIGVQRKEKNVYTRRHDVRRYDGSLCTQKQPEKMGAHDNVVIVLVLMACSNVPGDNIMLLSW